MPRMLTLILGIQALLTAAAAVVLVVAPHVIVGQLTSGMPESGRFLAGLLAAAEITIAWFSVVALREKNLQALRTVLLGFVVFHAASVLTLVLWWIPLAWTFPGGPPASLIVNIAVRLILVAAFLALAPRRGTSSPRPAPVA